MKRWQLWGSGHAVGRVACRSQEGAHLRDHKELDSKKARTTKGCRRRELSRNGLRVTCMQLNKREPSEEPGTCLLVKFYETVET